MPQGIPAKLVIPEQTLTYCSIQVSFPTRLFDACVLWLDLELSHPPT